MESLLFRTGSGTTPLQTPLMSSSSSPRLSVSLPLQDYSPAHDKNTPVSSPRMSLVSRRNIRRSSSESNIIRSEQRSLSKLGSRSFRITEDNARVLPECGISLEEQGGGGMNNRRFGGGGSGGNENDANQNKMGAYYKNILNSDLTNSLILRNYAKYLHEVERDLVKAEEYYGRAILASPGDGEVLSLYRKLIWETQRDESRAKSYYHQALHASPDDCMVLGSYAHFLWEAEEEHEDEEQEEVAIGANERAVGTSVGVAMVEAF